jgi:hypothetical protein
MTGVTAAQGHGEDRLKYKRNMLPAVPTSNRWVLALKATGMEIQFTASQYIPPAAFLRTG